MPGLQRLLPKSSILHDWVKAMSVTEMPVAWQILTGLTALGALLERNLFFDQVEFQIYPNQPLLLVGPSGIGKDKALEQLERCVRVVGRERWRARILGGRTIEKVYHAMAEIGDPATCLIPAPELSDFVGHKDYQKGNVQALTNLLTTKDYYDAGTVGSPDLIIRRPTVTVAAGTTEKWLQGAMPEGSLEGGFLPRFLVSYEEEPSRPIALVRDELTKMELIVQQEAKKTFFSNLSHAVGQFHPPSEMRMRDDDARDAYRNWYENRFRLFSPLVRDYANRSRDMSLRLAMLCAASRYQRSIDVDDVMFAVGVMGYVGERLVKAIIPLDVEARCAGEVLRLVPVEKAKLMALLHTKFKRRVILEAMLALQESKQITERGGILCETKLTS